LVDYEQASRERCDDQEADQPPLAGAHSISPTATPNPNSDHAQIRQLETETVALISRSVMPLTQG